VDLNDGVGADVVADVRDLPDNLGEFDVIFSAHVLEHLPRRDILPTVQHWTKYLKPGGRMHIFVPDLLWAAKEIAEREEVTTLLMMHLYGGQQSELQVHRMGFTVKMVRELLTLSGLIVREAAIMPYSIRVTTATGETESRAKQIYAVAVKPREEE
jgi:predicted SAM-dependent methyltransferase